MMISNYLYKDLEWSNWYPTFQNGKKEFQGPSIRHNGDSMPFQPPSPPHPHPRPDRIQTM